MHDHGITQARRFYHHVLNGGTLKPHDVSLMVQRMEKMQADIQKLREALSKIAATFDGQSCTDHNGIKAIALAAQSRTNGKDK